MKNKNTKNFSEEDFGDLLNNQKINVSSKLEEYTDQEEIKGLTAFDKFLVKMFPTKIDDNLENKSFFDKLKLFPIAYMSIILLLGAVGMRINYNMELNRNNQSIMYIAELKQNAIKLERNALEVKNNNPEFLTKLVDVKTSNDKIINVLKSGGKLPNYEFSIEPMAKEEFVEKFNKLNAEWTNNAKTIDFINNKSKKVLENKELISKFLNNNTSMSLNILKSGVDSKEYLSFNQKLVSLLNEMNELNTLTQEQSIQVISSLESLVKITSTIGDTDNTTLINTLVSELNIGMKEYNEFTQSLKTLNPKSNKFLVEAEGLTELYVNQGTNVNSVNSISFYKVMSAIIFLFSLVVISLLSLLFRSENDALLKTAKNLSKNQNNQQAVEDLFDVMSPLDNGDFTHKIKVEDKFLLKIAERIDKTRLSFNSIVKQIKEVSTRVSASANETEGTSQRLLDVSNIQYEKVGESIKQIGMLTNEMDELAQLTWTAQEQSNDSKLASQEGAILVKQSIQKMDEIRNTIQDSSKKIKKLSESAQSITEVTGIIQGITKQINILALNAAIQAASSGESGREFTVVAQEVQRLARDSEEATRTIEELINDIQTDTASAVASMEKTTQEVVAGAKLTDSAGQSLKKIDDLSMSAAQTVATASNKLEEKSIQMATIALELQNLQKVTEQASDIIRITAEQVETFKNISIELDSSVIKYKLEN